MRFRPSFVAFFTLGAFLGASQGCSTEREFRSSPSSSGGETGDGDGVGGESAGDGDGEGLGGFGGRTLADLGVECSKDAECASGHCSDGVCCQTTCGSCEACSEFLTGEEDGTCAPVFSGTDPHDECGLSCDGNGSCTKPGGARCMDHAQCESGFCTGGGTCALCEDFADGYEACWVWPYPMARKTNAVAATSETSFVAVGNDGMILTFDEGTGEPTWDLEFLDEGEALKWVCSAGSAEFVGHSSLVSSNESGKWSNVTGGLPEYSALVCGEDGEVFALGTSGLLKWRKPGGAWANVGIPIVGDLVVGDFGADGSLYVVEGLNTIHAISDIGGAVEEEIIHVPNASNDRPRTVEGIQVTGGAIFVWGMQGPTDDVSGEAKKKNGFVARYYKGEWTELFAHQMIENALSAGGINGFWATSELDPLYLAEWSAGAAVTPTLRRYTEEAPTFDEKILSDGLQLGMLMRVAGYDGPSESTLFGYFERGAFFKVADGVVTPLAQDLAHHGRTEVLGLGEGSGGLLVNEKRSSSVGPQMRSVVTWTGESTTQSYSGWGGPTEIWEAGGHYWRLNYDNNPESAVKIERLEEGVWVEKSKVLTNASGSGYQGPLSTWRAGSATFALTANEGIISSPDEISLAVQETDPTTDLLCFGGDRKSGGRIFAGGKSGVIWGLSSEGEWKEETVLPATAKDVTAIWADDEEAFALSGEDILRKGKTGWNTYLSTDGLAPQFLMGRVSGQGTTLLLAEGPDFRITVDDGSEITSIDTQLPEGVIPSHFYRGVDGRFFVGTQSTGSVFVIQRKSR